MAIIVNGVVPVGQTCSNSETALTYDSTLNVETTAGETPHQVMVGCGYNVFDAHPEDADARLLSKTVTMTGQTAYGGYWTVALSYGIPETQGDPEEAPIKVAIEGVNYQRFLYYDVVDGVKVQNSAGDSFDPLPEIDSTRCTIRITRNETTASIYTILSAANKINTDQWFGLFDPFTVKMAPPQIDAVYSPTQDLLYYKVGYVFEFIPETWKVQVLDAGFRYLDTTGTPKLKNIQVDGKDATVAVPLDGGGQAIAPPFDENNTVVLTYNGYLGLNFTTAFNFPPDLIL